MPKNELSPNESQPHATSKTTDIVVGIDGSDGSADALRWALDFASCGQSEPDTNEGPTVCPVVAWQPAYLSSQSPMIHYTPNVESVREATATRAQQRIDSVVAELQSSDRPPHLKNLAEVEVVVGSPASALLARAERSALLVVGSRGLGAFRRAAFGSVSGRCVSGQHTPTVVVPPGTKSPSGSPRDIVVGVDGSYAADAAAVWARTSCPDADITLLYCWQTPLWVETETTGPSFDYAVAAQFEFDRHVERIQGLVGPSSKPFETRFVYADARHGLTDGLSGHNAPDLLVVGAQEFHGLRRVILGSVAQSVLHHLAVPTAFVPAPDYDGEAEEIGTHQ